MADLVEKHGRGTLIALALIVVAGFGLRANRALNDPVVHPEVDADTYASIARSLYQDQKFGTFDNATDWSPGAPIAFAATYYLTGGEHQGAARLLNALFGTLTILVIYFLGVRLRGPPTGLLAAALVAFYPYFILDAGRLMSEPLGCLALASSVLGFLWALDKTTGEGTRSPWAWAVPGVLLGVTAMARPEYLVVALALDVVAFVLVSRRADRRSGLLAVAALIGAFLIPVLPWMVRDYVVVNHVVPISTGGGKALFEGTNLPADGDHYRTKIMLYRRYHPHTKLTEPQIRATEMKPLLDRVAARYPNLDRDAALGKIGRRQLRHYVTHDPVQYAAMLARKTGRMWTPSGRAMHPAIPTVLHYLLLGFALIGLGMLAYRRRPEALVFGLTILLITATGALLIAATRRNVVLMPLMITLAAYAMTYSGWRTSEGSGR